MDKYDVRVNLGGVVTIRVEAESKDEAINIVMDTIENSTIKELHKSGEIIKSVSRVNDIKRNKEYER